MRRSKSTQWSVGSRGREVYSAGKGGRISRKPGRAALSLTKWSPLIFTGQHANLCFVCIYSILPKYLFKRASYTHSNDFRTSWESVTHPKSLWQISKGNSRSPNLRVPHRQGTASRSSAEPGILAVSTSFTPPPTDTFTVNWLFVLICSCEIKNSQSHLLSTNSVTVQAHYTAVTAILGRRTQLSPE